MIAAQAFSALGMGLLLGILLGLSSSPVVGVVVGGLAALLSAFIDAGVHQKNDEQRARKALLPAAIRNGVFGFACITGVAAGMYARTHDLLSPSSPTLAQQVQALRSAGFTASEARHLVITRAMTDAGVPGNALAAAPHREAPTHTVLFGANESKCERLSVSNFASMPAVINAYRDMEEARLLNIAVAVRKRVPDEQAQMALLADIVEALCQE